VAVSILYFCISSPHINNSILIKGTWPVQQTTFILPECASMKTANGQQKSIRWNLSLWLISADLRRRSAAARLLGLRVRIPSGSWMSVCCVLPGRGLCYGPIPCAEESYRVCVSLSVIRGNNKPLHLQWLGRKKSD